MNPRTGTAGLEYLWAPSQKALPTSRLSPGSGAYRASQELAGGRLQREGPWTAGDETLLVVEGVSHLVCESQLDYGEETAKGKIDLLIPQNNLMQTPFIWNLQPDRRCILKEG